MKKIVTVLLVLTLSSCKSRMVNEKIAEENINATITAWHKAAAAANYDVYFGLMAEDAVFIGTDATEYWNKTAFQAYAKPHFDKGKAWSFTTLERHVFLDNSGKTAWFDELLNTQMKICRGSGVLVKIGDKWKIKQYVLSMTIPNSTSRDVIKLKEDIEIKLIEDLKNKE